MSNRLLNETSPYLRQHAQNPVDWYPWGKEAFQRAKEEDKPVFLSIGYSTCHWCHVMAHESFEDEQIAKLLNRYFISIKVDKEERPDIDSIYMSVCQAFTGSGGWPTSIFMTADQKPFFAGTYFPKDARGGMIGMRELLSVIRQEWETDREALISQAENIVTHLAQPGTEYQEADEKLLESAVSIYKRLYDRRNGGFGKAPKFPSPHNLLYLLGYYLRKKDAECLQMVEYTLQQMYRGGLFDHIGFGFSRYSTDQRFLVPHFEKMLYDNAMLILAYCKAHACSQNEEWAKLYLSIAAKTADYILREMTAPHGGFYSAQDADSEGEEGKFYLLTPGEISDLLGRRDGGEFCRRYDISEEGNFEGKSIPNLLGSNPLDHSLEHLLPRINAYRKQRYALHLDDKILTAWNGLMIAAMCELYRVSGKRIYLEAAQSADQFIRENLSDGDALYVSFAEKRRGVRGFLDDYAAYAFAQLALYRATLKQEYLGNAQRLCRKVIEDFSDEAGGGFYLYGSDSEALILRPKETYDGAVPSGNSLMAWNLVELWHLTGDESYEAQAKRQLDFLSNDAKRYPIGYAMFLSAYLEFTDPPMKVTVVLAQDSDQERLPLKLPLEASVTLLPRPTHEYPLKDGKTTYYVCADHRCFPPVNDLSSMENASVH